MSALRKVYKSQWEARREVEAAEARCVAPTGASSLCEQSGHSHALLLVLIAVSCVQGAAAATYGAQGREPPAEGHPQAQDCGSPRTHTRAVEHQGPVRA